MAKLTVRACATTKPKPTDNMLPGDGYGLWSVIHSGGTRSWMIDYVVQGKRRKVTAGNYDPSGGKSHEINALLGRQIHRTAPHLRGFIQPPTEEIAVRLYYDSTDYSPARLRTVSISSGDKK